MLWIIDTIDITGVIADDVKQKIFDACDIIKAVNQETT